MEQGAPPWDWALLSHAKNARCSLTRYLGLESVFAICSASGSWESMNSPSLVRHSVAAKLISGGLGQCRVVPLLSLMRFDDLLMGGCLQKKIPARVRWGYPDAQVSKENKVDNSNRS